MPGSLTLTGGTTLFPTSPSTTIVLSMPGSLPCATSPGPVGPRCSLPRRPRPAAPASRREAGTPGPARARLLQVMLMMLIILIMLIMTCSGSPTAGNVDNINNVDNDLLGLAYCSAIRAVVAAGGIKGGLLHDTTRAWIMLMQVVLTALTALTTLIMAIGQCSKFISQYLYNCSLGNLLGNEIWLCRQRRIKFGGHF